MAAITSLAWAASKSAGRVLVALGSVLASGARRVERLIQNRRDAYELAKFDDHMLADIGLTRSDVRDAYAGSVWSDPTAVLRARALERKLARHGISHGFKPEEPAAPPLVPQIDSASVAQARATFCNCG